MSKLAARLARIVWWWSLWFMRRSWMKRLQWASLNLVPAARRPRARDSFIRQNRFARRYGLRLIAGALNILFASMVLTACFQFAIYLFDNGVLTMSSELRERVANGE